MGNRSVDVAILGGGFNGLSAAWYLSRAGRRVVIFEKNDRLGGLARSLQLNGFSVENYYHHYFKTDSDVINMADQVGLGDQFVWQRVSQAVHLKNRLHPFSTPLDLMRFQPVPFFQRIKLGLLTQKMWGNRADLDAWSVEKWIKTYTGPDTYHNLFQPLIRAKFGIEGHEISAAFARGRLIARGASRGKFRWFEELGYLDGGSELLASQVSNHLQEMDVTVQTATNLESITRTSNGFELTVCSGERSESWSAKQVISTIPTPALVEAAVAFPELFIKQVGAIQYRGVIVATVALSRRLSPHYWISVVEPDIPFNALIEHTNLHGESHYGGMHVVYLGRYLQPSDDLWPMSDQEILTVYLRSLKQICPDLKDGEILDGQVSRDRYATPIFSVGYGAILDELRRSIPGLHLAGPLMVYPDSRNVNSAIRIGREIADQIIAQG